MAEFRSNLKEYRVAVNLTQEELAEKVNVRRETIIRLEAGRYNPSLKLAIDISRAVNMPIEKIDFKKYPNGTCDMYIRNSDNSAINVSSNSAYRTNPITVNFPFAFTEPPSVFPSASGTTAWAVEYQTTTTTSTQYVLILNSSATASVRYCNLHIHGKWK